MMLIHRFSAKQKKKNSFPGNFKLTHLMLIKSLTMFIRKNGHTCSSQAVNQDILLRQTAEAKCAYLAFVD